MASAKARPKATSEKKRSQPAAKKKSVKAPSAKSAEKISARTIEAVPVKKPAPIRTGARPAGTAKVRTVSRKSATSAPEKEKTGSPKERLNALRKDLLNRKETILKEAREEIAKYVSGDNRQLVDTALDEGDWAQVDISEDINLQRLAAHRKLLHGIDEAVRKIAEGTYGICEECGEEISGKRLRVLPSPTLCIDCQENKEQFEKLEPPE